MTGRPDNPYPDEGWVLVRYPRNPAEERGDRAGWPWLAGWVAARCGPDEWQVVVQDPALAQAPGGGPAPPGTPEQECMYPVVFRDSTELRPAPPGW